MIKQYKATYKDADGNLQSFDLMAYDVRKATMGAAELIPVKATLIRVIANPDWN